MDSVILTPLKQIYHSKGDIFHALKKSDDGFHGFGEAYFSSIRYNTIKGWKKHTKMTLNLVVPVGDIEIVIYDEKEFKTIQLSQDNYRRLTVKPNCWIAFRGLGKGHNLMLNLANIEHDPSESVDIDLNDIEYQWT
jgi:dTDP-4-dehydrorhamnose 3,5-epimerase